MVLAGLAFAAGHRRRHATTGGQALDVAHALEHAAAGGRIGLDQLQRDVAGRGRHQPDLRAGQRRAVVGRPGRRRAEVAAQLHAAAAAQLGVRADEDPLERARRAGLGAAFIGDLADADGFPGDAVAGGHLHRRRQRGLRGGGHRGGRAHRRGGRRAGGQAGAQQHGGGKGEATGGGGGEGRANGHGNAPGGE